MPGAACAFVVLDRCEAVDDAASGAVSGCDSALDSGDSSTAGVAAAGKSATARRMVVAKHQRQQGPVHIVVVIVAGSGMNRNGVGGVGEVSVQPRVVAAGYLGRAAVYFGNLDVLSPDVLVLQDNALATPDADFTFILRNGELHAWPSAAPRPPLRRCPSNPPRRRTAPSPV
jgi:hypothetical protein